jgi:hypothetical protein
MAQPARERLLEAAATAEGSLRRHDGAAYGVAQPRAAGEPGQAGRGRRSRARRRGNGAWPPYGADDRLQQCLAADCRGVGRRQRSPPPAERSTAKAGPAHSWPSAPWTRYSASGRKPGSLARTRTPSALRSCSAAAPSCRLMSTTSPGRADCAARATSGPQLLPCTSPGAAAPPVQRPSRDHAPCGRSRWTTAVTGSDQQALFRAADVVMSTSDADIENRYWPPANET